MTGESLPAGEPAGEAVDGDDLAMVRDTARRFFAGGGGYDAFAELGFTGLLTPANAGGSGWLPVEAAVVAEEAGRARTGLPLLGGMVGAAAAAAAPAVEPLVPGLLAGEVVGAVAGSGAGVLDEAAGTFTGTVTCVGHRTPQVVAVVDERARLFLIDCSSGGAAVDAAVGAVVAEASTLDTTRPSASVAFAGTPATVVDREHAEPLVLAATLLACADALGALGAGAALVRGHLSERVAFGQRIASFQAIQHRLADLEILEASATALLRRAASALAAGAARSRSLVAALHDLVGRRVPAALDDCIQLSGGIGFTWEWPVHDVLRRALVDASLPRPPGAGRADLVAGGEPEPSAPDGPAAGFRARARAVIRAHRPFAAREGHRAPTSPEQEQQLREWYRTLYAEGLLGASWPPELGGDPDHHPRHDLILTEELIRARAPRPIDQVQLASHTLLAFGTDEQKARYLPRIRDGRDIWCQLFSEPDAGSDLAGIKARAERRPDGTWVLSGQKTWTTDAHWAQMGLALLRTPPTSPTSAGGRRHAGLTAFVVPMDAPGLVVQPKRTIGGAFEFNDVFLDGVVLPADSVVGEVGGGWAVAMSGLQVERLGVGGNVVLLDLLLDDLAALVAALRDAGRLRVSGAEVEARIAGLAADAEAAKAFVADHVDRVLAGREHEGDAAIGKLLHTETYNRIARSGVELVTAHQPVPAAAGAAARHLTDAWLWSRALTISGGSSEVMRTIIAKRRLGLPQA